MKRSTDCVYTGQPAKHRLSNGSSLIYDQAPNSKLRHLALLPTPAADCPQKFEQTKILRRFVIWAHSWNSFN